MDAEKKLNRLILLFDKLFGHCESTLLVKGGSDPLYVPKNPEVPGSKAEIHFAHGFFSSALHEIAHWLIAGRHRRTLLDYGYWYKPDGRSLAEQKLFEAFESRNQGLEWILSVAANHPFHVSSDNLAGSCGGGKEFSELVRGNAVNFLDQGFSVRTSTMVDALIVEFGERSSFDLHWQRVRKEGQLPAY